MMHAKLILPQIKGFHTKNGTVNRNTVSPLLFVLVLLLLLWVTVNATFSGSASISDNNNATSAVAILVGTVAACLWAVLRLFLTTFFFGSILLLWFLLVDVD